MYFPERRNWTRESTEKLPASGGWEARLDGMVNICELLINFVNINKPKMLTRLEPKGVWKGCCVQISQHVDSIPPEERRNLTHCVT
jgi:hypothetical protein